VEEIALGQLEHPRAGGAEARTGPLHAGRERLDVGVAVAGALRQPDQVVPALVAQVAPDGVGSPHPSSVAFRPVRNARLPYTTVGRNAMPRSTMLVMGRSGNPAFGAWLRGRIGPRSYGHLATYV